MGYSSRDTRKILHTSDLHIRSIGDNGCDSLETLVNLAIMKNVDLVIFAGDLFDHNRMKDDLIHFVTEQLQRLTVPAVILPGNHDCLIPDSIFDRAELWEDCDKLQIFMDPRGETLEIPELGMSLWGKPISSDYDDILPLEGMPSPQENGFWHIAVAHGYFVSSDPPLFPSYHITQEEIAGSGWDYVALGHIPIFRCICDDPVAYYSGSPSFSNTIALVELAEDAGARVTPCRL